MQQPICTIYNFLGLPCIWSFSLSVHLVVMLYCEKKAICLSKISTDISIFTCVKKQLFSLTTNHRLSLCHMITVSNYSNYVDFLDSVRNYPKMLKFNAFYYSPGHCIASCFSIPHGILFG